jgi:hypothetical protein
VRETSWWTGLERGLPKKWTCFELGFPRRFGFAHCDRKNARRTPERQVTTSHPVVRWPWRKGTPPTTARTNARSHTPYLEPLVAISLGAARRGCQPFRGSQPLWGQFRALLSNSQPRPPTESGAIPNANPTRYLAVTI